MGSHSNHTHLYRHVGHPNAVCEYVTDALETSVNLLLSLKQSEEGGVKVFDPTTSHSECDECSRYVDFGVSL